jgi:hypothetical protein
MGKSVVRASNNKKRASRSDVTSDVSLYLQSETGKTTETAATESRRQSIFDIAKENSAISAQMVANNPSAAASVAFASLQLPPDLSTTSSKKLRQLCSPIITCMMVVIIAACLVAAVYFAVVLNSKHAICLTFNLLWIHGIALVNYE